MASNKYPFKWTDISPEEKAARKKIFTASEASAEVEVMKSEPYGMYMCTSHRKIAEEIYNFELRPDDIWIVTYPKCGTTWTQEIVWQISRGVDRETAKQKHFLVRSPFLEMQGIFVDPTAMFPPRGPNDPEPTPDEKEKFDALVNSVEFAKKAQSPRIIKTHLPFEFLPPKLLDTCKVIYVCRNVKDVCVSYFHHTTLRKQSAGLTGTFMEYADLFKKGELVYGNYWSHLKSAWSRKEHPNLKIIWYEEMKKDLDKVLRELCDFTKHPLTEDQLRELKEHVTIDNMRKIAVDLAQESEKEGSKKFFRKGQVGDWKNYFQGATGTEWDAWIQDNLEGTNIDISFE